MGRDCQELWIVCVKESESEQTVTNWLEKKDPVCVRQLKKLI